MSRGKSKFTLVLEAAIHSIVDERAPITVRGVAYALFTQGHIPDMGKNSTQKVSRVMTNMRESGDLDWRLVVDNSRIVTRDATWRDPDELIEDAIGFYRKDYWASQPKLVEVWSEKATVQGVLSPVLKYFGVTLRTMTGFGSFTVVKQAAVYSRRRPLTVFYVGDHDPSGRYMTDVDLPKRLERYGADIHMTRIAINEQDFHLPKFSAGTKSKDPRYQWFAERYGNDCWEIDAMDPNTLRERVQEQIESCLDLLSWNQSAKAEKAEIASMREFQARWQGGVNDA